MAFDVARAHARRSPRRCSVIRWQRRLCLKHLPSRQTASWVALQQEQQPDYKTKFWRCVEDAGQITNELMMNLFSSPRRMATCRVRTTRGPRKNLRTKSDDSCWPWTTTADAASFPPPADHCGKFGRSWTETRILNLQTCREARPCAPQFASPSSAPQQSRPRTRPQVCQTSTRDLEFKEFRSAMRCRTIIIHMASARCMNQRCWTAGI